MSTEASHLDQTPDLERTRWRIDPARSRVEFHVPVFGGLMKTKGRFQRYHGTLQLSAQPAIELTIAAETIDTANEKRDTHLRSADFFDVENHPEMRFVSDSVSLQGERLQVRGRLQAAGGSMPLELEASLRRVGGELELEAVTKVDRRQLGMTWDFLRLLSAPSRVTISGRLVPDLG